MQNIAFLACDASFRFALDHESFGVIRPRPRGYKTGVQSQTQNKAQ